MLLDREILGEWSTGFLDAQLTAVFGAGAFDDGCELRRFETF